MTKTIEEAAREFAKNRVGDYDYLGNEYEAYLDGSNDTVEWLFSQPLSQRLTDEEKKRVRIAYNAMSEYGKSKSSECCSCANFAAKVWAERIFGKDFFRDPPAK